MVSFCAKSDGVEASLAVKDGKRGLGTISSLAATEDRNEKMKNI
jgi:hypothetical protein